CLPLSGIEPATPSTIDFGAMFPFTCIPACNPPCLRFAAAVTGRHARLGTRLLARLCRGRHFRRLSRTRLQGTTRTGPIKPSGFFLECLPAKRTCGLPYAVERLCPAAPPLCPVRALPPRVPLAPPPCLPRPRSGRPRHVG